MADNRTKIVSAGLHRSGSTWLFNVLREICLSTGKPVHSAFESTYKEDNEADYHIVKIHREKPAIKALAKKRYTFMTIRDFRDIAASAIRLKQIPNNDKKIYDYLYMVVMHEYIPWSKKAGTVIRYEEMMKNKPAAIAQIAKVLDISVDAKEINSKVESLTIPKDTTDESTLLHPNHITGGKYQDILDVKVIKEINRRFGVWMRPLGYIR